MRIIHDIETPVQVVLGTKPYGCPLGKQGYNGMHIELVITEDYGERGAIYIEGNANYIREALQKALQCIDLTEKHLMESMGDLRASNCPNCNPYDEQPNVMHLTECPMHVNHKLFHPDSDVKTEEIDECTNL